MNMKITAVPARNAALCVLILFGLLLSPIVFLFVFVGGMPDRFAAPFVNQWPLLTTLWASNPGAALQVLMQQPLLVIAHSDPAGGTAAWRLFYYPAPVALQLAISILAVVILRADIRDAMRRRLMALLPGVAVLVFVTTYVQLASCCTGGPRWALDVWLFALAYDPGGTLIDWQALYSGIEGALSIVQIALALVGVALLVAGTRSTWSGDTGADPLPGPSGSSGNPS